MTGPSLRRIILLPRAPAGSPESVLPGPTSERKDDAVDSTPSGDASGKPSAENTPGGSLIIDNVSVPKSLDPRMMSDKGGLPGGTRRSWAIGRAILRIAIVLVMVCIAVPRMPRISVVMTPPPTNNADVQSVGSAAGSSVDPMPQARPSDALSFAPSERNQASPLRMPAVRPQEGEIIRQLMRGKELLARGEIAAARSVFQRVADAGEARGALALAETYEPSPTARLSVNSLAPNLELAKKWYEKARGLGSTEAERRLEALAGQSR